MRLEKIGDSLGVKQVHVEDKLDNKLIEGLAF